MTRVFENCDAAIDSITGNILDSKQYFTAVDDDITDIKNKITMTSDYSRKRYDDTSI